MQGQEQSPPVPSLPSRVIASGPRVHGEAFCHHQGNRVPRPSGTWGPPRRERVSVSQNLRQGVLRQGAPHGESPEGVLRSRPFPQFLPLLDPMLLLSSRDKHSANQSRFVAQVNLLSTEVPFTWRILS